jgi:DNA polymerase-3 subunit epsilon
MKTAVFFDTETSGLPLWDKPSESPEQPHIVQLAAVMVDLDTKDELQCIDVIIKPDGWVISPEMTAIHGISHEMAMDIGISEKTATEALLDLVGTRTRIAHNQNFDARIMRIAIKRYLDEPTAEKWKAGNAECTAQLSRSIVALPKTKIPTLTEAYTHFFGKPFENAHSALADVMACRDVYFAVKAAA